MASWIATPPPPLPKVALAAPADRSTARARVAAPTQFKAILDSFRLVFGSTTTTTTTTTTDSVNPRTDEPQV